SLFGTQRPPSTPGNGEPVSETPIEPESSPLEPPSSVDIPPSGSTVVPESVCVVETGPHLPLDSHTPDAQSAPTWHWGDELEQPAGAKPATVAKQTRTEAVRRSILFSLVPQTATAADGARTDSRVSLRPRAGTSR